MEDRRLLASRMFPSGHVREMVVVAFGFPLVGLVLLPEMAAAGFLAVQGVLAEKLREFEIVGHPPGLLERLVEVSGLAGNLHVLPEFRAQLRNPAERLRQTPGAAGHPALIPHQFPKLAVKGRGRALAADGNKVLDPGVDVRLGRLEFLTVDGTGARPIEAK